MLTSGQNKIGLLYIIYKIKSIDYRYENFVLYYKHLVSEVLEMIYHSTRRKPQ